LYVSTQDLNLINNEMTVGPSALYIRRRRVWWLSANGRNIANTAWYNGMWRDMSRTI